MPAATLSLDLDDLWSYLKTHGDPDWEGYPSYLEVAVPRALDFLAEAGLSVTFFVVGHDASLARNQGLLRRIADAGHEIANHSYRHEPWLHRYSRAEVSAEIESAEAAILEATGVHPVGFRGPGYSLSPSVVEALAARGYLYDATTLPTWIGPLARAYYFRSTSLSSSERAEREALFGSASDGLKPLAPFRWQVDGGTLIEMPVSTVPVLRTPFHFSYLLYLASYSPAIAKSYLGTALKLCRWRGITPSMLFHPLDLLGPEDVSSLKFFPGMGLTAAQKAQLLRGFVSQVQRHHRAVPIAERARSLEAGDLRSRLVDAA